ncbi:MAG: hypothetical protein ACFFAO_12420 [Candidatus Hermodarchaeota archaeon]
MYIKLKSGHLYEFLSIKEITPIRILICDIRSTPKGKWEEKRFNLNTIEDTDVPQILELLEDEK